MQDQAKRKGLTTFLLIAFGGSWAAQFAIGLLFRDRALIPEEMRPMLMTAAAPVLMWPPAIGALVARKWVEKTSLKEPGLKLPKKSWLAISWALPIAFVFATILVSLPINAIDTEVTPLREAFERAGKEPPMPLGMLVLVQILAGMTVGALINSLFAFGEEYGWRGYLLPRLMERMGAWRGILLHGAIWGVWHAPLIALIGYNYPQHPYLGVFLFIVFCTLMGIVMAWLQLGSGSVWAPTLAHAVFNATAGIPMLVLKDVDNAISGMGSSLVGMVVLGGIVFALVRTSAMGKVIATANR